MANDMIFELILFVREHGWRLDSDHAASIGGHDKFVVTTETAVVAEHRAGETDQEGKALSGGSVCALSSGGRAGPFIRRPSMDPSSSSVVPTTILFPQEDPQAYQVNLKHSVRLVGSALKCMSLLLTAQVATRSSRRSTQSPS